MLELKWLQCECSLRNDNKSKKSINQKFSIFCLDFKFFFYYKTKKSAIKYLYVLWNNEKSNLC